MAMGLWLIVLETLFIETLWKNTEVASGVIKGLSRPHPVIIISYV